MFHLKSNQSPLRSRLSVSGYYNRDVATGRSGCFAARDWSREQRYVKGGGERVRVHNERQGDVLRGWGGGRKNVHIAQAAPPPLTV